MSIRVKVCGLRTATAVQAATLAGVQAIGFVFASSPRKISLKLAAELLPMIPEHIERVAVFRSPDPSLLLKVLELPIDTVQADALWVERTPLPGGFHVLPVVPDGERLSWRAKGAVRAIPVGRFSGLGDVLVDSAAGGGSGQPANWSRVRECAAERAVVLAGGLTAENVSRAVAAVRPVAVDVSSGVESRPGLKDPDKIWRFVEAVRAIEEKL
jgi:phosphoribosylanthranilate isomerase